MSLWKKKKTTKIFWLGKLSEIFFSIKVISQLNLLIIINILSLNKSILILSPVLEISQCIIKGMIYWRSLQL